MVLLNSALSITLLGLATAVSAHPGHDVKAEAAERAAFFKNSNVHARGLSQCASKLKTRGLENRNVARRAHAVKHIRERRGLKTGKEHSKESRFANNKS